MYEILANSNVENTAMRLYKNTYHSTPNKDEYRNTDHKINKGKHKANTLLFQFDIMSRRLVNRNQHSAHF